MSFFTQGRRPFYLYPLKVRHFSSFTSSQCLLLSLTLRSIDDFFRTATGVSNDRDGFGAQGEGNQVRM